MQFVTLQQLKPIKRGFLPAGNYLNNGFQRKTANSWRSGNHSYGKEKATPVAFSYFLILKLDLGDKTYLLHIFLTYSAFSSLLAARNR